MVGHSNRNKKVKEIIKPVKVVKKKIVKNKVVKKKKVVKKR